MKCFYSVIVLISGLSLSAFAQPQNYTEFSFDTVLITDGVENKISVKAFSSEGFHNLPKNFGHYQQLLEDNRKMLQNSSETIALRREKEIEQVKNILRNHKIAYFTEVIGLTEGEGARFWPVYLEYERVMDNIIAERQLLSHKIGICSNDYSPHDEKYCSDYLNTIKKEADTAKDYYNKFKQILPPQKLLLLYNAEIEFKKIVFRRFKGELL